MERAREKEEAPGYLIDRESERLSREGKKKKVDK